MSAEAGLGAAAVVVESLEQPGRRCAIEPAGPLSPASMIKVPIAAAAYELAARGLVDMAAPIAVSTANMTANDAASPLVPGYRASFDELIDLMIARSDNVATNELIDAAGRERLNEVLHAWGLRDTFVRRKLSGSDPLIDDPGSLGRNAHPARDAAALLRSIAAAERPASGRILAALRNQAWNDKLSRGWAGGDTFAHKTGDTSEVSHDGGILTTADGGSYVIVVYTPLPSGADADARIAAFARSLRPFLNAATDCPTP
jgi:beta-lactamase class A